MKVLSLSDVILDIIYSPNIAARFADIDLVIGCGDLPYYYLEYVVNALNVPLFFVRGNHANIVEYSETGPRSAPLGGVDLHRRVVYQEGLLLAGVEGCLRYRRGPFQYTQSEMWGHVLGLVPMLLFNRLIHGRYLDVFVTHAPPWGIHDQSDLPHQGITAFRWLLKVFKPTYHFHGHIHIYRPDTDKETLFKQTRVINSFGYVETELEPILERRAPLKFFSRRNYFHDRSQPPTVE